MVCACLSPAKPQLAEPGVNGISPVPWVGAARPARLCSSSSAPSHGRKERMKGKVRSYLAMRLKNRQRGRHLRCVLQKAAVALLQPRGCSRKVLLAIWSLWLWRRSEKLCFSSLTRGSRLCCSLWAFRACVGSAVVGSSLRAHPAGPQHPWAPGTSIRHGLAGGHTTALGIKQKLAHAAPSRSGRSNVCPKMLQFAQMSENWMS